MENKKYMLNTLLAAILGVILAVAVFIRTFAPQIIFWELGVPNMVLISLAALLADYYLAPGAQRCYICIPVLSAVTFGLLPFAGCFVGALAACRLAVTGGIVFTVTTWLFSSMADRISTGPAAKLAPIASAVGLYLASQCFMGMF